jgi:hypothetical protein
MQIDAWQPNREVQEIDRFISTLETSALAGGPRDHLGELHLPASYWVLQLHRRAKRGLPDRTARDRDSHAVSPALHGGLPSFTGCGAVISEDVFKCTSNGDAGRLP